MGEFMRNIIVFCLLLASLALAQKQSIVVLPPLDPESKLTPKQLDILTEEVRTVVTKTLDLTKDFILLKQDEVRDVLGDAAFVNACEEGTCIGKLVELIQANFGARCDIFTDGKQLYMKFELYGTLKGESKAGTIDQFNEPVKDFANMQAMIKKDVPAMLTKIMKNPQEDCRVAGKTWRNGACKTPSEMMQDICESGGNIWIGGADGVCKTLVQMDCESKGRVWVNETCRSSAVAPAQVLVPGGVSGLQSAGDYEFSDKKRYLVNITTEPEGAVLSFNGMPDARCIKTPCKTELTEGRIRIIADLEQYEKADTTVSITQNNQNVSIKLKANFGVLDIRPAYLEGVGANEDWHLSINDKSTFSLKNNLSSGKYKINLDHECYEPLSFDVGINRDKREVFDMADHVKLKKGGLILSAEQDGDPVSEPVFINGKPVGETPFSGSVPVCSDVKIGKEKVRVQLEYQQTVRHTHKMPDSEERRRIMEEERKITEENEKNRTAWMIGAVAFLGGGISFNMNDVYPGYFKSSSYQWNVGNVEFYRRNTKYIRFGFNLDIGGVDSDRDGLREMRDIRDIPADSGIGGVLHIKVSTFIRWYPVDYLFLSGGVGWDLYNNDTDSNHVKRANVKISTPVFPAGGGICLCTSAGDDFGGGIVIEALYNTIPFKGGRTAKYISINAGIKLSLMYPENTSTTPNATAAPKAATKTRKK
jgi:hypothetical protein